MTDKRLKFSGIFHIFCSFITFLIVITPLILDPPTSLIEIVYSIIFIILFSGIGLIFLRIGYIGIKRSK